ncbi:MAG TPA: MATE family efflux transporter [Phycisphaerales bacterium]|nr:MATE family efflux transporter [Phycisphaerales bacterium]
MNDGHERPLRDMLRIAGPSIVTMTSYTVMQFVDGLMVSRIGPDPVYVAAQFNGAMLAFVPISFGMGLLGVVNTFVSQNLGAGRPERGAAYGWNALWIAVLLWAGLLLYLPLVPWLFGLMQRGAVAGAAGHSDELVRLGTGYAQTLLWGGVLTLASRGLAHFFYGMHRPRTVMIAALTGNLVNVGLNWVLIFGKLGVPALGVKGAAIATVLGTGVELAIVVAVFLSPAFHAAYGTRRVWRPSGKAIGDLLRLGWSPGLMFGNEMVCWTYFMAYLVGMFGDDENAVGAIVLRYMHLSFMPAVGMSIAVTAMVGRAMGARRPEIARRRAYLGLKVTVVYMLGWALLMVAFRGPLIAVFIKEGTPAGDVADMLAIGGTVMLIAALFQVFDAMAITLSAALRGAGDTVLPGVATVLLAWVCILGGGHAMVEWRPDLRSVGPWLGAGAYIVLLGLVLMWRFARGRWMSIDVLGDRPVGPVLAPEPVDGVWAEGAQGTGGVI